VIELALYLLHKFSRPREGAAESGYLAYSIGPEMLAIAVNELDADNDEGALKRAAPLFHEDLKRIEVWCGSRKVGDIPPRSEQIPDGEPIRHSA
jgi:hypothetical protein